MKAETQEVYGVSANPKASGLETLEDWFRSASLREEKTSDPAGPPVKRYSLSRPPAAGEARLHLEGYLLFSVH